MITNNCFKCNSKILSIRKNKAYCPKCKAEIAKIKQHNYYIKNKTEILTNLKIYYKENRDVMLKRSKSQDKKYLSEYMKKYRQTHADYFKSKQKIYLKEKVYCLSDTYVKSTIRISRNITFKNPPQELIEFTREHLRLKRLIKEMSNN